MTDWFDKKRFEPNFDGRYIIDNMTGKEYPFHSGAEEPVIELLNQVNDRADRNAEMLYKFEMVMRKYQISSVEKLDRILFERGVW